MNRLETQVKNGDICYESESYRKQREKTLQMSNNGNENQAVRSNGLLDDLETNMVCRYVQNLKSDRLTWGFQNRFGPENWTQWFLGKPPVGGWTQEKRRLTNIGFMSVCSY